MRSVLEIIAWLDRDRVFRDLLTPSIARYARLRVQATETPEQLAALIRDGATHAIMDLDDYEWPTARRIIGRVHALLGVPPLVASEGLTMARCLRILGAGGMPLVKTAASKDRDEIAQALGALDRRSCPPQDNALDPLDGTYVSRCDAEEERVVKYALMMRGGVLDAAADSLGMKRSTYKDRVKKFGLSPKTIGARSDSSSVRLVASRRRMK